MLSVKQRVFKTHLALSLETLVPPHNFYRRVQSKLDIDFVRELVAEGYSPLGRPSIDPVVFFKLHLIMFFEGIRSERQLVEMVNLRLDHRWYLGYDLDEVVPDHSSLTKIRDRYGVAVFQAFFERILTLCVEAGLVWGKELYVDGTMIEANADYERQIARLPQSAQEHVEALFTSPDNPTLHQQLLHKYNGSLAATPHKGYQRQADEQVSLTDPSATTVGHQRLGYRLHYGVDGGKARIVLSCLVTPASIQDNTPMLDLVWWAWFRWQLPLKVVVGDTRYGTIDNIVALERNGIRAFFPLQSEAARQASREHYFPADAFHYDPQLDFYICPQGQQLTYYRTDAKQQRHFYKAPAKVCRACPLRSHCSRSQRGRQVSHSVFKDILDRVQAYATNPAYRKAMRKRAVWIEPRFADLKLWHHGRRFRLRGLLKVNIEALLKATGQNIQQLLKAKTPGKLLNPAQAMTVIAYPISLFFTSLILPLIFNSTFSTLWLV
jgi:transposase